MRFLLVIVSTVMFTFATADDQTEGVELLSKAAPPRYNDVVEELKDMLVVSMQNVVSNNDLVTKLTEKVVLNMLSVSDNKQEIENVKKSYMEEVSKLKEEIESLKKELSSEIGNREADLQNKIERMETGLNTTLGEITEIRRDVAQIKQPVTIVSAEDGLREQGCAKVCAGTTGRASSNWVNYSTTGIKIVVDISGCGFVTVPTVTTSLEGKSSHSTNTGGSEIYSVTTSSFTTYINTPSASLRGKAREYQWNMEWIAVGYTC